MKDRWITLLFAIGAFLAFYQFFVGPVRRGGEEHSRPLSTETRANGYFVVRHWLETQGVPVVELRHRYDWLQRAPGLPKRGNLLVTTIPHKRWARPSELGALHSWAEEGNAILVAAGLFDTPEWGVPEPDVPAQLYSVSRLRIRDVPDPRAAPADDKDASAPPEVIPFVRLATPKRGVMRPNGNHPLTREVPAVHAESEFPAGKFVTLTPADAPMLSLMSDRASGIDALWLTWIGDGAVIVSGYGSVLTNKMLSQAANADLMANIVAELLGPRGHVIFDDIHQGAASFYDAEAFFGDPRLHASFWWIVALWLLWVLGRTRLPPPAQRAEPVREHAFVTSTGHFFARVLERRRIAERMFDNFFNDYRRSLGQVPNGAPLWAWMRGFGAIPPADLDRLEELHARVAAGKRVNLIGLHNLLQHLRKQLR
jgi:hypothetical protein